MMSCVSSRRSTSFHVINPVVRQVALKNLSALGLKVTYGRHAEECDLFNSSSVNSRLEDLHEAFSPSGEGGPDSHWRL